MNYPLLKRPALALLVPALAPALGGTASPQAAFTLGVVTVAAIAITGVYNMILGDRVAVVARVMATAILAVSVSIVARLVLEAVRPSLVEDLTIFLPLVAINVAVLRQAVIFGRDVSAGPIHAYLHSLALGALLVVVLTAIGTFRWLLPANLEFFRGPGGLLIAMGTCAAAVQAVKLQRNKAGAEAT